MRAIASLVPAYARGAPGPLGTAHAALLIAERDWSPLREGLSLAESALHLAMLGSYAFMAGGFAAHLLR